MIIGLIQFLISILYPLHNAIMSVKRSEEERFPGFIKYFSLLVIIYFLDKFISSFIQSVLFDLLVTAGYVALIKNKFELSMKLFDKIFLDLMKNSTALNLLSDVEAKLTEALNKIWQMVEPIKKKVVELVINSVTKQLTGENK